VYISEKREPATNPDSVFFNAVCFIAWRFFKKLLLFLKFISCASCICQPVNKETWWWSVFKMRVKDCGWRSQKCKLGASSSSPFLPLFFPLLPFLYAFLPFSLLFLFLFLKVEIPKFSQRARGSAVSSPSEVWGEAVTEIKFGVIYLHNMRSGGN